MPGIGAADPPADDGVEVCDVLEKLWQRRERELTIGIGEKNEIKAGGSKTAPDSGTVAAINGMCYRADVRIFATE